MGQNQISFKLKLFLWINGIHTIMNYLFKNTLFYFFSQFEKLNIIIILRMKMFFFRLEIMLGWNIFMQQSKLQMIESKELARSSFKFILFCITSNHQNIKICFHLVRERIPAEQNFYSNGTLSHTNCVYAKLVPSFRLIPGFILVLHFEC